MQQQERYYPQFNSYNKPVSKTSMPVDESEAWLKRFPQKRAENKPNGGIIRSVADTRELFLRPMSKADRAAAIAQAQREHKQALKNLARQDAMDAKEISKQLTQWRKENKKKAESSLSAVGQDVFDTMKEKGFYEVADFKKSYKYLQQILAKIRALGYSTTSERKGGKIIRYFLEKK